MTQNTKRGVWKAADCALVLSDYQEHILDTVWQQDRRVIELNICTLAKMAVAFKIPVILSTVGVEMGSNGPTIASLRAAVPGVRDIDRSSMNAWDDSKFVAAVKATGRKKLVMGAIATSVCLAFPRSMPWRTVMKWRSQSMLWATIIWNSTMPRFFGLASAERSQTPLWR